MMVSTTSLPRLKQKNNHSKQDEQQQQSCQSHHHHHKRTKLLSFLLFLLFLASCTTGAHAQRKGSEALLLLAAIPDTAFRCDGRNAGYYADMEAGCQVYHMCDTQEKQFSFLCPNYTLFNQKFTVCDHWYMVNCTMSKSFFEPSDNIGEVPGKGANTVDGGNNNQSMRKSTILAQKTQAAQSFKAIVPISMIKFQGTTKTTNAPIRRPTSRPTNVPVVAQTSFFTIPKSPFTFTTKSTRKTTNRPSITQSPLFTTKRFVSTTPRPKSPFSSTTKSTRKTTKRPPITQRPLFTTKRFTFPTTRPLNRNTSSSFTTPKPARVSVFNRVTLKTPVTPKPARASIFNRNKLTNTTSPNTGRTTVFNRNTEVTTPSTPAGTLLFNHTSLNISQPIVAPTKKPFTTIFPGSVTRSPGSSFSFAQMKLKNLTITRQELDGLVFRPLVANPFSIKNGSSIPSFAISSTSKPFISNLKRHPLVTRPNGSEKDSDEEEVQTSQHSTQQFLAVPLRAFALPSQPFSIPVPSRLLVPPPSNVINNHIPVSNSGRIEPPTARRKGFSPIKMSSSVFTNPQVVRTNPRQETPLTPFTKRPPTFSPFGRSEEVIPGVLHINFQSARGNRDFFIPSSGLTLPDKSLSVPSNFLTTHNDDHDHDDNDNDIQMTMLFPGSSGTPLISGLVLNPKCPHCHPAFLRPGHCTPCVRIRR